MDPLDRQIINTLQGDFPVCARPFAAVAERLDTTEEMVIAHIAALLQAGVLSRFGPMYDAERMGGAFTLAALSVPEDEFDHVAAIVNGLPQVAHNYRREHPLNLWFVLAAETPDAIERTLADIERRTGLPIYNLPKLDEFYIGLRFEI
ncbi:MAG TPA: AsnC family protein [Betaproteobacteria bacterium]|nr:AsnC family protein [Betaproteobacteria bacterium]